MNSKTVLLFALFASVALSQPSPIGGGGSGTINARVYPYYGLSQGGVANWSVSLPSSSAPLPTAITGGTSIGAFLSWPNNTSTYSCQSLFIVPSGFTSGGTVTVNLKFQSSDTTHNSLVNLSYAVIAPGSSISNPTFTSVTGVNMMGTGANNDTEGTITFTVNASRGNILMWKLIVDTTALTGGATFDLTYMEFSVPVS